MGRYQADYTTRDGTCGDAASELVTLDGFNGYSLEGCTQVSTPDQAACAVGLTFTCPTIGGAWTNEVTLHLVGKGDVLTAQETKLFRLKSGAVDCQGTYSIILTRQP
jgi:hypothetical protein